MDSRRSRFGHAYPLLLAVTQTDREVVTKKVVHVGYSLNPVAPIPQPHNPVYTPLRFALRAYLGPFVLKDNLLEERSEKNQSDLSLH